MNHPTRGEAPMTAIGVLRWIGAAAAVLRDVDDTARLARIGELERIAAACAAAQAELSSALLDSQLAADRTGDDAAVRRSVAAQVALARRESPHAGRRHLGLARALTADLPRLLAAMRTGLVPEYRAMLIAAEWGCLTPADRRRADELLAPRLDRLGTRGCRNAASGIAAELDAAAVVARIRGAVGDRRVTIRPAPDCMALVSALLPVAQGVSVYAALRRTADHGVATGDGRSRAQLMADALVARVTGRADPSAGAGELSEQPVPGCDELGAPDPGIGINVQLLMTDRALLDGDATAARLTGYGPIPAPLARRLVLGRAGGKTRVWVQRLYTAPDSDRLISMDSNRRLFPEAARRFLIARDQTCRTPWCDAPIRHVDHVIPSRSGGRTSVDNGQGLCESCNYGKESAGWKARLLPDGTVVTVPPAGALVRSREPDLPRSPAWPGFGSPVEAQLVDQLLTPGAA